MQPLWKTTTTTATRQTKIKTNGSDANILAAFENQSFNMSQKITINFIASDGRQFWAEGKIGSSLMELSAAAGIEDIAADCGGLLTCATCHVFVSAPFAAQIPPAAAEELSMLDFTGVARKPNSRLSCQITLTAALDGLTVELPSAQY